MKKERIWTFLKKISKLKPSCRRGILTRPQVGYFQVAIQALGNKLARASYYIMRDRVAYDSSKLFG